MPIDLSSYVPLRYRTVIAAPSESATRCQHPISGGLGEVPRGAQVGVAGSSHEQTGQTPQEGDELSECTQQLRAIQKVIWHPMGLLAKLEHLTWLQAVLESLYEYVDEKGERGPVSCAPGGMHGLCVFGGNGNHLAPSPLPTLNS